MSKHIIDEEILTTFADWLRLLDGTTDGKTPDKMIEDLSVEYDNIQNALAALADKGVEVPDGANASNLVELIESCGMYAGTFVANDTTVTIENALKKGASPYLVAVFEADRSVWMSGATHSTTRPILTRVQVGDEDTWHYQALYKKASSSSFLTTGGSSALRSYFTASCNGASSTNWINGNTDDGRLFVYPVVAGFTYGYVAFYEVG